jgi:DNA polymerase zeta
MSTRFRVFESHLSYILQFMCDFGLYGCGWLEAGSALQRSAEDADTHESERVDVGEVSFAPSSYFRQSRMALEFDVIAPQILNRHRISARNLHQKIEIPSPPLPSEPLVLSVHELWEDERQRRRAHGLNPSPEIPLDPSDSSREPRAAWVAEARWWEDLRDRMERERGMEAAASEGSSKGWEHRTMTTFESIEALWEAPWKVWKPARAPELAENNLDGIGVSDRLLEIPWDEPDALTELDNEDIDVDVSLISSQEISQMIDQEEADWARLLENDDLHFEDEENEEEEEDDLEDETEHEDDRQILSDDGGNGAADDVNNFAEESRKDGDNIRYASSPICWILC